MQTTQYIALREMRVAHYTDQRIADPLAKYQTLSWQDYHTARNSIVRACRVVGPTGPSGECTIDEGSDGPDIKKWQGGDADPVYYVLDDQLNHEHYIYVEVLAAEGVTPQFVSVIADALGRLPNWGVGVTSIQDAYIVIFPSIIMVTGSMFTDCHDASSVLGAWRDGIRRK